MPYPLYVTPQNINFDNSPIHCATIIAGTPTTSSWMVVYDNLDGVGKSDLAGLVAANSGVLPLTDLTVAKTYILPNGKSWYDTYVSVITMVPPKVFYGGPGNTTNEVYFDGLNWKYVFNDAIVGTGSVPSAAIEITNFPTTQFVAFNSTPTVNVGSFPSNTSTTIKYTDVESLTPTPVSGVEGSVATIDYLNLIGQGLMTGHSSFRGFGEAPQIGLVTSGRDIWMGATSTIPLPLSTGERMMLVSTSVLDDNTPPGTGITSVTIEYLDALGNPQVEVVIMDGTTPVSTVATDIRFVQSMEAATVGTNGTAVGNITIYRVGSPTIVFNAIPAGGNSSLSAQKMVPAGKTFYMTNLHMAAAQSKSVSIRLQATSTVGNVLSPGVFHVKMHTFLLNSTISHTFALPLVFPSLCIIKGTGYQSSSGGGDADVSIGYDGWIE